MATATLVMERHETDATRIMAAGLTVAVLDAVFAIVLYVVVLHVTTVTRVFQSIAAGLLGKASFSGGAATVLLGVLCHLTVAFGWTLLFYFASRRSRSLREVARSRVGGVLLGLAYGMLVWLGMDLVVIPLSRATATAISNWRFWAMLAWHAVGVGTPIVRILR